MSGDLPPDLLRILCDPTLVTRHDHEVRLSDGRTLREHLEEWRNAPSNTASATATKPEGREGIVTVYDHEGRYLGCMGRERWDANFADVSAAHVVTFTAEDGVLTARCSCGWVRLWSPDEHTIQESGYGILFGIGLRHTYHRGAADEGKP